MARAVVQSVFTVLLALLSMQGVVPSTHFRTPSVIVFRAKAKQQTSLKIRPSCRPQRVRPLPVAYVSRTRPEPNITALSQRPPPESLFL